MNIIQLKKYKKQSAHQIYEVEKQIEKFLTLDFFRSQHEDLEKRISEIVDIKIGNL